MEQSTNFGFNLPSRDTDDIVDVNQISDNFRIIDENMVSFEYIDKTIFTKGEKNIFSWDTPDGVYTCPKGKFITFETRKGGTGNVPSDTILTTSQCLIFVGSNPAAQYYRDKFFTIIGDFTNTDYIFDENGISIHQIIGTYAVRGRIDNEFNEPEYWFDIPFSQKGKKLTTNDFTDEYKKKLDDLPNDVYSKTESDEANDAQNEKIKEVEEKSDNNSKAIATEIERVNNTFAPVIKNTASGETINLTDVSPIEHTVGVKVRSKNLFKTTNYSKGSIVVANGTINKDTAYYIETSDYIPLKAGTYTISYKKGANLRYVCLFNQEKEVTGNFWSDRKNPYTFTIDEDCLVRIDIERANSVAIDNYDTFFADFEVQLELGNKVTTYTPYVVDITAVDVNVNDTFYTPNADGTVDGVLSIYPEMNIFTNKVGVLIEAKYNADTKKYIDNKIAELQALVLEG